MCDNYSSWFMRHLSIRRTEFALEKQYNEYLRIEFSHRENMKTGVIEIQTDSLLQAGIF